MTEKLYVKLSSNGQVVEMERSQALRMIGTGKATISAGHVQRRQEKGKRTPKAETCQEGVADDVT